MIVGFLIIIYISIQNQKLDEKLEKVIKITQRTPHSLNPDPLYNTSIKSSTRSDRHIPASYPSILTQELNFPNPTLENINLSSNLEPTSQWSPLNSTHHFHHSSSSFPFIKKHPKSHRFSLSNSPNPSRFSPYSNDFRPIHSSDSKDQEQIVDHLGKKPTNDLQRASTSTPDRPGRLPVVPDRSRLSSLIRQTHPHIILAYASDPTSSTMR
ncbi:hypothetical protein DFH28DRAFT_898606 [Melampsora americana]|nr:hypothetical protein DFH28DRAFT_898606 [Melampsora americana]